MREGKGGGIERKGVKREGGREGGTEGKRHGEKREQIWERRRQRSS